MKILKKIMPLILVYVFLIAIFFIPIFAIVGFNPNQVEAEEWGYIGSSNITVKECTYYAGSDPMNYMIWEKMFSNGNPFPKNVSYDYRQCTAFAWGRFYQTYHFDSGARGDGKTNAREIVMAHPDKFVLSSTPSPNSVFSSEWSLGSPVHGHVGYVESFDGENIWISHGNTQSSGGIQLNWKYSWQDFKNHFCRKGCSFAVPKK